MEQNIKEFIGGIQSPIKKLNITELRQREETWRALWSWIPDDVKRLLYRVGTEVRLIKRDYKGVSGMLGEVKFEAKEYELTVYEKRYNESDGKWYYEHKVCLIPSGAIMMLEFIMDKELAEEAEVPEVKGFEEGSSETLHNLGE